MAKKRYKFNPQTLTYDVIAIPFRIKFYRFLRKLLIAFIIASIFNLLFSFFFYTPKMYRINENNRALIIKYNILNDKIDAASQKLAELRHRDKSVYRSLFAVDTMNIHGVYTLYSETKYDRLRSDMYTPLMSQTWMSLDAMSRLLYLQSKSLDELELLSKNKELMAEAIPAIWPIDRKFLRGNIGAFGRRRHPIHNSMSDHKGIDMGANTGTPIYATGNGRISFDLDGVSGYGKQIVIDHGFGYRTRYAHLSKILVTPGQTIKRGEMIGEVGNTGQSNGPHLHYEVIYMRRPVDPLNYFSRDMSEEEFAKIVESAQATTYEKL